MEMMYNLQFLDFGATSFSTFLTVLIEKTECQPGNFCYTYSNSKRHTQIVIHYRCNCKT